MSLKIIVSFCLLATAFAAPGKPFLGLNIPAIENQIIGGEEAEPGEFPWQISLHNDEDDEVDGDGGNFCGGAILSEQWILTAGHCVYLLPAEVKLFIKAGKHNLSVKEEYEQEIGVEKYFVHEKYTGQVGPYDIGLLKLKDRLSLNERVQKIALPAANSDPSGEVTLSGWGVYKKDGIEQMPNRLQKFTVPIVPRPECSSAVRKLAGYSPVDETTVCTGPLTGGYSACNGDSGSGLVQKRYDGTYEVVGVFNYMLLPCGAKGAPSMYTRVSVFRDWLEKTMTEN